MTVLSQLQENFSVPDGPARDRLRVMHIPPLLCCLALSCTAVRAQVVINEIHYHPVELPSFDSTGNPVYQGTTTAANLDDDVHEFIELRNAGNSTVLLNGWKLTGGISYDFPGTASLAAGGFLVVAKVPARITAVYPPVTAPLG